MMSLPPRPFIRSATPLPCRSLSLSLLLVPLQGIVSHLLLIANTAEANTNTVARASTPNVFLPTIVSLRRRAGLISPAVSRNERIIPPLCAGGIPKMGDLWSYLGVTRGQLGV